MRCCSSETLVGGGVVGVGGKSKEVMEEVGRWRRGDAGLVIRPASLVVLVGSVASKRKPRSSRAWITVGRDLSGTRMKSDQ